MTKDTVIIESSRPGAIIVSAPDGSVSFVLQHGKNSVARRKWDKAAKELRHLVDSGEVKAPNMRRRPGKHFDHEPKIKGVGSGLSPEAAVSNLEG